jgi:hypothetical protein
MCVCVCLCVCVLMLDLMLSNFIMKKLTSTIFILLECVFSLLLIGRCYFYYFILLCFLFSSSVPNMLLSLIKLHVL